MATPFIAQISMFGGNFAPRGWAFCDGQILSIAQNTALFSLLGTTYGGDGQTTFALPDLRGRVPMHPGQGPGLSNYALGQTGGTETTTLGVNNLPPHNHGISASAGGQTTNRPTNGYLAAGNRYTTTTDTAMAPTAVAGSGQAFNNVQPYQTVNFIIALQGIFPSRN
ncbi:MAG: tail fiber protein [Ilumatobacter sp.]|uniref:phage tail protein n=1 Tax=Ilumatobacter sp. TaxID=1967498 RepID=UPI003299B5C9